MSEEEPSAAAGPWGAATPSDPPPARERMFNAPWPALAIVGVIILSYVVQISLAPGDRSAVWAFAPADLDHGRWLSLFTAMFIHVSWAHALMNAVAALAFGPPVARLMGLGWKGPVLFFLFYLACGVIAGLGYAAVNLHSMTAAAGASGAVTGLMGGAARLLGPDARPIAPIFSQSVVSLAVGLVVVSLLTGLFGAPLAPGVRIGWEAHIAGFVAGVLLIGPFARLAGWRRISPL